MAVGTLLLSCVATVALALGQGQRGAGAAPPHFEVPVTSGPAPLTFVVYGDTRFTHRPDVVNSVARRALVAGIAAQNPAAIFIGGDLVYQGSNADDYAVYREETAAWRQSGIPVFPALGNHEFKGCAPGTEAVCLGNWWSALEPLAVRPWRWYSVSVGREILALVLDSDSALTVGSEQRRWFEQQINHTGPGVRFVLVLLHYPPVRDPLFPPAKDEKEIARYLRKHAALLPVRAVVIGSHVHNYERYSRYGVTWLVSGGGGATPVPTLRIFGERSHLHTAVNFHYLRFVLDGDVLTGTMVRFDPDASAAQAWSEPDRFQVRARPRPALR
ncbi:MAG: metallophosphoesterase [Proteobacteria bacterium]|nr:metallophosphoesterase [Pseudomonadota bacterium]